jgi:PAS domain S-box-containing protein
MDDELRILVLGDEESPEDLIDYELSKSNRQFDIIRVTTLERFLFNLQEISPNLILITTGCAGISALTAVALAQETCPGIPCFVVSPPNSQAKAAPGHAGKTGKTGDRVQGKSLEPDASAFFEAIGISPPVWSEDQASVAAKAALEPLMQVSGVIIVFISPEGRILEFNRGAERLTGWHRLEILGKDGVELCFPPSHRRSALVHLQQVLAGKSADCIDLPLLVRDGSTPAYRWYCNLICDRQGQASGIMLVGQPLTESKPWEGLPRARLARCHPSSPTLNQGRGLLTRRTGTC